MRTSHLAALVATSFLFAACKKEKDEPTPTPPAPTTATMRMQLHFMHGANPFNINTNYTDGAGHAIRFSTLKFYISGIHLKDDMMATVADFHNVVLLADGANPAAVFDLGTMNPNHVHEAHFNLGLEPAVNHADPITAPYPLNIPGMHWSWNPAAGYKFLNMEGHVDGNGDGDFDDLQDVAFAYHCATDALLREDHVHVHADVTAGATVVLSVKVDVAALMNTLDLLADPVAMGGGPNNVTAMNNLVVAIDEM